MNKLIKFFMATILGLGLLAGCGAGNSDSKVLRFAETSPSNSLNNLTTAESVNFKILNNLMEGLTRKNISGQIEPAVAEKWDVNEDKTIYTFHLRDTKWSNNEPVTAHDFKFAWDTMKVHPKAQYGELAELVAETKVIDDQTLEVTLVKSTPYILELFATIIFAPVNQTFYEAQGDDVYGTTKDTILFNGPYELTEYTADSGYTLQKRPNYWDAKNVSLETIEAKVVQQPETQAAMFDNGEIDFLELSDTLIDQYGAKDNVVVQTEARTQYMYLSDQMGKYADLLGNHNFRQAIAYAIDKNVLAEQILKDGSTGTDALIPKGFAQIDGQYYRDVSGKYNDLYHDKNKAIEYLNAAKAELGDVELAFDLYVRDSKVERQVFESIVSQLNNNLPGVHVTLKTMPSQVYFNTLFEYQTPAAYSGWGADFEDPISFFDVFTKDSSLNFALYQNEAYNEYIELSKTEEMGANPEKRWETFFQAEEVLIEDYNIIPLYQKGKKVIVQNNLKNISYEKGNPVTHYRLMTK